MKKIQKIALKDAKKIAGIISKGLKGGEILGLIGPLGSGKTTFAKALGKKLKVKKIMSSPTFTLLRTYDAKLNSRKITLYHLDFYRNKTFKEISALGIAESWGKKNTLTLIEWADKFKKHLPEKTKLIYFNHE